MEETISLQEIMEVIRKHVKLIIGITVGAVIIAALVSYFIMTPIYESNTQFIVNESNQGQSAQEGHIDSGMIRTNVELINTYNVIITSNAILDVVIENLQLDYSAGTLKNKLSVSSEQNSQVVTVTAKDPDPALATAIANETVTVFQELIPDIMNVDNVKVLTEATTSPNPVPVEPNPKLNIAIALVLGVMIGVGIAFLIEYLDTKVRTDRDVEATGLTVIGTVFTMKAEDIRLDPKVVQASRSRVKDGKGDIRHV